MKRSIYVLVALSMIGMAGSREISAGDAKTEFEGTWELVSLERDGKKVTIPKDTRTIATGDKFVVKAGDVVVVAGTFKLDPGKKPKTVDITYTEGPDKGKTFKGIYEISGDMAKFCHSGSADQERPTEFKTKPESGGVLSVYKRQKH